MEKTRDVFKKTGDIKGTFHARVGTILDRNSKDLTEAEHAKKRWQEYGELYKKVEAVALLVVVELFALLHEGDGIVHAVRCAEGGGDDAEVVERAVFDILLLVDEAEGVALLYAEEVDGPPEDVG